MVCIPQDDPLVVHWKPTSDGTLAVHEIIFYLPEEILKEMRKVGRRNRIGHSSSGHFDRPAKPRVDSFRRRLLCSAANLPRISY